MTNKIETIRNNWESILEQVREDKNLSNVGFQVWIEPLELIEDVDSKDENIIRILVPEDAGEVALPYVSKKFTTALEDAIRKVTGTEVGVLFERENEPRYRMKEEWHDDGLCEEVDNQSTAETTYLQKWGLFTEKLRRLMAENPELPVVISELEFDYVNPDCSVACVQDRKTGRLREKIILIHNSVERFLRMIPDDYIELPFH